MYKRSKRHIYTSECCQKCLHNTKFPLISNVFEVKCLCMSVNVYELFKFNIQ